MELDEKLESPDPDDKTQWFVSIEFFFCLYRIKKNRNIKRKTQKKTLWSYIKKEEIVIFYVVLDFYGIYVTLKKSKSQSIIKEDCIKVVFFALSVDKHYPEMNVDQIDSNILNFVIFFMHWL